MKIFTLLFILLSFTACKHSSNLLEKKKSLEFQSISRNSMYTYRKKVFYEENAYPETLLDSALIFKHEHDKKSIGRYYNHAKKAFVHNRKLQNGIFSIFDNQTKKSYLQENKKYMDELLNATYKSNYSNYTKDTFDKWLNYKRTLFDDENSLTIKLKKSKDKNLQATKRVLDKKYRELGSLNQKNNQEALLEELYQDTLNFEKQLNAYMTDLFPKEKIDTQIIANILKAGDELYIDFAKTKDYYYYFILDKNNRVDFGRFSKRKTEEIDRTIGDIIENLKECSIVGKSTNLSSIQKPYSTLYNLIIDKKIKKLIAHKNKLIISPDGLLNLIPFESLYNRKSKKYLIQTYSIGYIPSGRELYRVSQKDSFHNNKLTIFSNPNYGKYIDNHKNFSEKTTLGFMKKEKYEFETLTQKKTLETLQEWSSKDKNSYIEENATESAFMSIVSPELLHLFTHAFYEDTPDILNPLLKSGFALSGANNALSQGTGEGIVTSLELAGTDLSQTELVVLSACETGIGELQDGEGVTGLSKAFLMAGSKYIVTSLWSVDEKYTDLLMSRFYKNIRKGESYSKALRDAKISIINTEPHPYYWAAFIGNGREK